MSLTGIKAEYDLAEKFKQEIDDMVYVNRLVQEDGYIKNTPKGIMHAKIITFLRNYLNIGGHQ